MSVPSDYPLSKREELKFRTDGVNTKVAVTLQNEAINIIQNKTYLVGEPIGAGRAVRLESGLVYLATDNDYTKAYPIGISLTGANSGHIVVQEFGDFYDSSLNLIIGELVFLGPNGVITQTPPTIVRTVLGFAIASNGLRINISEPILV